MAKDPSINWYFDNWDGGTKLFTRHVKGCYIDLLSAQFHNGPLSLENIKTVLGSDFQAVWPVISKKFTEQNGEFFNERLESERRKRVAYSESRSKNRKKKDMLIISNSYVKHMNNIPGIGIDTEIKSVLGEGVGEDETSPGLSESGFFLDSLPKEMPLTQMDIENTVQFISIIAKQTLSPPEIINYWEAFKIQQFGKHEWKNSRADLISHFRDSLKYQINANGKGKKNNTHKPTITGTASGSGTI